ncbi:hypothetical protein M3Y99_00653800 [Aphelenchoides fujianensis]|nr:hypothetical protein M3Y99_00653800 [Aphelenchoides fujianensis]
MSAHTPHSGLFVFFLLLSSAALSSAYDIVWTFYPDESGQLLKVTIGSPNQNLFLQLGDFRQFDNMRVSNGSYFITRSQTFEQTGLVYDDQNNQIGVAGLETFVIGDDGVFVQDKPLQVINEAYWGTPYGSLGWMRPSDGSDSFVMSVLKEVDDTIVVFSFDEVQHDQQVLNSGQIRLGALPHDRCVDNWAYTPEGLVTQKAYQWSMSADEIEFGAYTYDSPGRVFLSLQDPVFAFPQSYLAPFLKALGAVDEQHVSCDVDVDFIFYIGQIHVTADDYLDRTNEQSGHCALQTRITPSRSFYLPSTIFLRYCLLLDYENFNLGFTERA